MQVCMMARLVSTFIVEENITKDQHYIIYICSLPNKILINNRQENKLEQNGYLCVFFFYVNR